MSYTITLKIPENVTLEETERFATSHRCTVYPNLDIDDFATNPPRYSHVFKSESFDCIHELASSFLNADATDLIQKI